MPIVAKSSGPSGDFAVAPSGVFSAVCVDVVDLGQIEVTFGGKTKSQHKIRVVWQIEEDDPNGKPFLAFKRYTLSLHEKAALRADLEAWRGKKFTDLELDGFDVEKLIGAPCMLQLLQEVVGEKTYANVKSIMQLRKGMEPLKPRDFVRFVDRPKDGTTPSHGEPPPNVWGGIDDSEVPF